jgi:hypothetical protein
MNLNLDLIPQSFMYFTFFIQLNLNLKICTHSSTFLPHRHLKFVCNLILTLLLLFGELDVNK